MKALILEQYGSPFVLKEIATPVPGKGEVLVKIIASAVNPLDLKIRAGLAAHAGTTLPAILGIDMAGIVQELGEGVTGFKRGDEVYGMTGGIGGEPGSLAGFAAVDSRLLAIKPKNFTMQQAAALPLAFITAWEGLVDRANVREGQTVLVQGGTGGVGHLAVQLAVARGAKVFATDRPAKASLLRSYSATPIDFKTSSVEEYVQQHTGSLGFDIVFDTVGGATLDASFRAAKIYTGHVVSILGWGSHSLAPLSFRGATYSGVFTLLPLLNGKNGLGVMNGKNGLGISNVSPGISNVGPGITDGGIAGIDIRSHHGDILRAATVLTEAGQLIPIVDPTRYTMSSIEKAYAAMENRTVKGKLIIEIME